MPKHKINSSKKGILFTLVTIILFILMLGELITYIIININYNNLGTSASVILDSGSFAQSASAGTSAFLHDSLRTSLNALIYYESNPSLRKDYFVNNTALVLESLINNGTILGNTILKGYMGNSTMSSFLTSLKTQAAYQNLNLNITNSTLTVYQGSPFTLNASFTALAIVNSSQGTFTYPIKAQASISLNGTADLYEVESANPQQIRVMNSTLVTVVGNTRAAYGSSSPFMFDYGTILVELPGISCASVPSQYRNSNYILATSNAIAINQSVCNMGGLVTYIPNTTTPLKPYLVYSSSSNIFNYLQNGTKLLLSGSSLSLLNISGLKSTYNNNYYYPSLSSPSYLDSAEGNLAAHSGNGMFSLYSLNRHVAQFNGQSSYIQIPNSPNLQLSTVTFGGWVNYKGPASGNWDWLMAKQSAYGIGVCGSSLDVCFYNWGTGTTYQSSYALNKNTWYFLLAEVYGGNEIVYVNSVQVYSGPLSISSQTTVGWQIGYGNAGGQLLNGSAANIQIYNTILSPAQIQTLYQEGIGGAPVSSSGLVGWWPLNGNANDYSGNGNNGVPTNVVYTNLNNYVGNPLSYGTVGNKYNYQTVAGFGCSNTANCVSSSLFMPSSTYILPVTLTNSQSIATPAPFQQMISFNPSTYSAYEASNLGNIRFYQNGTELYSWCESGCSSASSNAIFWVKLPNGIPASSSITINMTFEPVSTNYDGVYAGEAPQLGPTYGEYDNGASVFDLYFNGDTPTSDFVTGGGDTVAQETGVTLPNGAIGNVLRFTTGSSEAVTTVDMFTTTSLQNSPNYYISEASFQSDGSGVDMDWGFAQNSGTATSNDAIFVGTQFVGAYFDQAYISGGSRYHNINAQGSTTTSWRYSSLTYNSLSSFYAYIAPQLYSTSGGYSGTVSTNPIASISPLYWGWWGDVGASGHWTQFNWVRVRAYPPNGVMPSVSFSSVMPYPLPPDYNLGAINGALLPNVAQFNGQNGYIAVDTALPLSPSQITVCAWINPTVITGSRREIVGNDYTSSDSFFLSLNNNGNSEGDFWVHTTSGWYGPVVTPSAVPLNTWSFLCGNWTGTSEYIYLNGKSVGGPVTTSNTISLPMGVPIEIGADDESMQWWDGSISDIQIYNTSLSAAQVQDLYLNNSVPGVQPVAYWPLSGGLNGLLNVTPDAIGSYTGQLYGNPSGGMCTNPNAINGQCGVNYVPG